MNLLNYLLNEVKQQRVGKEAALGLIMQWRARTAGQGTAALHPLLQRNTSELSAQRFSTQLTGSEFFLAEHVVRGRRVLPGVASLEMAREALLQAGVAVQGQAVRLKNVAWIRPVVVDEPIELHVGLYQDAHDAITFELYSGDDLVHSEGTAEVFPPGGAERLDLDALRAQCTAGVVAGIDCYARFAQVGLDYGPGHQALQTVYLGERMALARLQLPASV
ncbi:polyketide synthase dehydratase domain-containing protein, partial [Janthinobacterium sp.]|uniref:polyketide synthase dehydratase domain-containing protein n=1 Tax=Janthinobacterium sp. TaxID=1871054 RepID=UPI00258C6BD7